MITRALTRTLRGRQLPAATLPPSPPTGPIDPALSENVTRRPEVDGAAFLYFINNRNGRVIYSLSYLTTIQTSSILIRSIAPIQPEFEFQRLMAAA